MRINSTIKTNQDLDYGGFIVKKGTQGTLLDMYGLAKIKWNNNTISFAYYNQIQL